MSTERFFSAAKAERDAVTAKVPLWKDDIEVTFEYSPQLFIHPVYLRHQTAIVKIRNADPFQIALLKQDMAFSNPWLVPVSRRLLIETEKGL